MEDARVRLSPWRPKQGSPVRLGGESWGFLPRGHEGLACGHAYHLLRAGCLFYTSS